MSRTQFRFPVAVPISVIRIPPVAQNRSRAVFGRAPDGMKPDRLVGIKSATGNLQPLLAIRSPSAPERRSDLRASPPVPLHRTPKTLSLTPLGAERRTTASKRVAAGVFGLALLQKVRPSTARCRGKAA